MANEILMDQIETPEASSPQAGQRSRAAKMAGIGLAVIAAAAAGFYYVRMQGYESTDNAFLEGSVIQVSPRVGGQVLRVNVTDNQHVIPCFGCGW